ncbi:MAG: hypothetical protein V1773_07650 [bacterium]
MKFPLLIAFVFALLTFNISAQNTSLSAKSDSINIGGSDSLNSASIQDSVNIRALLDKEIAVIKAKQKEEEAKSEIYVISSEKIKTTNNNLYVEYGFWVIEAILIMAIGIFWNKRIKYRKKIAAKTLKLNISKMREEKIITGLTNDLTEIRRGLVACPIRYDDHGMDIVRKARDWSISKGEVYLAVKLKILAGEMK